MKNFHFIFDKTEKAIGLKKQIFKKYKSASLNKSDCIIVAGGDGFMLKVIKKNYRYKKPFYGINCGSYGFLMNNLSQKTKKLEKIIKTAKKTIINPLSAIVTNVYNKSFQLIAINEISFLRQNKQTTSLEIKLNKKILVKNLIGDGAIISSPAGSTAYNLSVGGPVLSLNSERLSIVPISPFRPRLWKGNIVSNKKIVKIKNLNFSKRPLSIVADNVEIRNVKKAIVQNNKKIKITILHDKNKSFDFKNKNELVSTKRNKAF